MATSAPPMDLGRGLVLHRVPALWDVLLGIEPYHL